jgi:hypothetical protein
VLALAAATLGPTMLAGAAATGYQLTVNVSGNGYVTDATGVIHCPSTCQATIPAGTFVQLYAYPNGNDTFQGWSGDCQGTTKCSFDMGSNKTVGAGFTGTGPQPSPSPTPSPSATPTPQPTPTPTPSPSASPTLIHLFLGADAALRQSLHLTHHRIRLQLRCSRTCKATVTGTIRIPHVAGTKSLKTVKRTLVASSWTAVGVRPSSRLRAAITTNASKRHPAVAHLSIDATAPATKGASTARTVRLIP